MISENRNHEENLVLNYDVVQNRNHAEHNVMYSMMNFDLQDYNHVLITHYIEIIEIIEQSS